MFDFKKFQPHLIALGVFIVLSFLYFTPVFDGKVLSMHDMIQANGMTKELVDYHKKTGIDALWESAMFSGMPSYQIARFPKLDILQTVFNGFEKLFPEPVYMLLLALISFYVLLYTLKLDHWLCIAGAVAFSFSSYFFIIIGAGHITKALAIASAPLVVAGIIRVFQGDFIKGGLLTILAIWIEVHSSHPQITYYLVMILMILFILEFIQSIREKALGLFFKACLVIAVAAVLGILPSADNLWSTYEYGKHTTRSPSELTEKKSSTGLDKDYALAWSYGVGETMTLVIPGFKGGASYEDVGTNSAIYKAVKDSEGAERARQIAKQVPTYWGDQPSTAGPTYAGAISFFLFVLALFFVRGYLKWWLVVSTILVIMLSWGRNFMAFTDLFFNYFPGYNKFRAVAMILSFVSLTFALLGFLGLKNFSDFTKHNEKEYKKKLVRAYLISGGLCLLFALVPSIFCNFIGPEDEQLKSMGWPLDIIKQDRESLLRGDAFRSFIWITASAALLWFYIKGKLKKQYLYYGLIVFLLIDLWPVNKRYLNNDNFVTKSKRDAVFIPSVADEQIMQDKELGYRVMNLSVSTFNDATTSYFHHSIGGYHGAKLKRYQELIEYQISKNNISVLNMLNTKYFIVKDKQSGELQAQRNPDALGPAWFVKEYKIVPNADSEIAALTTFNPAQTAIIDKRYENNLTDFQISHDSSASIKVTSYVPNEVIYETKATAKQLAVFSEIFYDKGWNAYIDGKLTPHFRVNYVLRGMIVPEGNHKVEFKFEPENYYTAEKVSLASSILNVILLLVYGISLLIKKSKSPVA